jgi:starch synthase (maltosyl-transferring)
MMEKPEEGRNRVVVENLEPEINCGRYPVKRVVDEVVSVEADVFTDGHDGVRARLLWKHESDKDWQFVPMASLGNDRWRGEFSVTRMGRYFYTVTGDIDRYGTWRNDLRKRMDAGQDISVALETGGLILEHAAALANKHDATLLRKWAKGLKGQPQSASAKAAELALQDEIVATVNQYPDAAYETRFHRNLEVTVDRERAGFSAWYELFPRSWSATPGKHGTLRDVADRLEYVAEMGFNVLYLPPVSPIGTSFRKGKNNNVEAAPGDVGSPWAIGAKQSGHTAIHPDLGTFADFEYLVKRAKTLNLEIALDIAFQASPDHPWVAAHPEFFRKRPDGTIQYAENPPKKYQDIYPLDFESSNWQGLWDELKSVFTFWIGKGVKIFRVDNPHTKAFPFWEWVIAEIKAEHPDVLFLAEAFTRPRVMERLAKLGFSQSYTYFTWRNTKQELTEYIQELTQTPLREYFRPNFWPNTPDILAESLKVGGTPGFKSRLVLAGTMVSNYGIYGPAFELQANTPVKPGSEEYLDSEKYEIKKWDITDPTSLKPLITRLNRARNQNKALQSNHGLRIHAVDNPQLLCYSKRAADATGSAEKSVLLMVVNLDPVYVQSGFVNLDLAALGLPPDAVFDVEDLLADHTYRWQGPRNYVELRPAEIPAHVFRVKQVV